MPTSQYTVKKVHGGYQVIRTYGSQKFIDSGVIRDKERALQVAAQKQRGERIHEGP